MEDRIPESVDLEVTLTLAPIYSKDEGYSHDPRSVSHIIIDLAADKLVREILGLNRDGSDTNEWGRMLRETVTEHINTYAKGRALNAVNQVFDEGRIEVLRKGVATGEMQTLQEYITEAVKDAATPRKGQYNRDQGNDVYEMIQRFIKFEVESGVKSMLAKQKDDIMRQLTEAASNAFLRGMGIDPQPNITVLTAGENQG